MIDVYKLLQGKYDSDVSNIVKMHKDSDTREGTKGHNLKLFLERDGTNFGVTRLWNDLPEVVVTAPNHLDRHWSTEEFLYN